MKFRLRNPVLCLYSKTHNFTVETDKDLDMSKNL